MSRIAERILQLTTDATVRKEVNDEAQRLLPNTGARCAMTVSLYLKRANIINKLYPGTIDLQRALEKLPVARINDYRNLLPGDICFTQDLKPKNDKPDHVYFFVAYDGPKSAMIVDNQSGEIHSRNLLSGSYTPFAFALRLLDNGVNLITDERTRAAFVHFYTLERQGHLSQPTAKLLHEFRNAPEFKEL